MIYDSYWYFWWHEQIPTLWTNLTLQMGIAALKLSRNGHNLIHVIFWNLPAIAQFCRSVPVRLPIAELTNDKHHFSPAVRLNKAR